MKNAVLQSKAITSQNYFHSDLTFRHFFNRFFSEELKKELTPRLDKLGAQVANEMIALSLTADKNPPKLIKRNFYGENIDEIEFHPAYEKMLQIAIESGMFSLKWEPSFRQKFSKERHQAGFAAGFFYAMAESSQYCPLCMTDGVARLIDLFASKEDQERLLPRIYTEKVTELYTGAMFLTEKTGGSDVGANIVTATKSTVENEYLLNGEKWFCSNANADIIFALARTRQDLPGTKGLGIFLVERNLPNGEKNPMELVRLKDKLGTKSMASAEYIFQNTQAKLIGQETEGFKIMTEMINLSRLYNAVAALSGMRRALIEVWQYLNQRLTFGKNALEHALVRRSLSELLSVYHAQFYLTWHCIRLLDEADQGSAKAKQQLRFLTPLVKRSTAAKGVWMVRECMELMGGIGYIEDGILPRIMRDMMVLPIWEGTGNIMILDMLRAEMKDKGLTALTQNLDISLEYSEDFNLDSLLNEKNQDVLEWRAHEYFEWLTNEMSKKIMLEYRDEQSKEWIDLSLNYFPNKNSKIKESSPISVEELKKLMAFEIFVL